MNQPLITDKNIQRLLIISVAFANCMGTLDSYIVNISLPTIANYFNVSPNEISRVTLVYLLVLTATLLIFGKIGDKFGFKKVFMGGYLIFVIGSLFCGISSNLNILIISRALQALGGSMLLAIGPAIITQILPANVRGRAFGIVSIFAGLGITLGAPLGGFITSFFDWHWIFLINIPIGIIAMFVANRIIPSYQPLVVNQNSRFDFPGAILIFISISSLIFALHYVHELGWTSPTIVNSFIITIITFTLFIFLESRVHSPLLDLKLFKMFNFSFSGLASLSAFMLMSGNMFIISFYLILAKGLKPDVGGLVLMLYSLIYMTTSPFMGKLSDKIPPRTLCCIGMISASSACFFFSNTLTLPGLIPVVIFLIWLGLSYGSFISPNNNLALSIPTQDKIGIASGVFRMMTNLGLTLGVTFFEMIFTLSLPENIKNSNQSLSQLHVTPDTLFLGFKNVYMFGAVICFIAFIFSFFISKKKEIPVKPRAQVNVG